MNLLNQYRDENKRLTSENEDLYLALKMLHNAMQIIEEHRGVDYFGSNMAKMVENALKNAKR